MPNPTRNGHVKVATNMSSGTYRLLGRVKAPRLVLGEWPKDITLDTAILWVLKIAVGLNMLFHGAWGVVGKEDWIPFFAFAAIGAESAEVLQRLVGVMDITLGLIVLFMPTRWAILWILIWTVWTASLRPLTGSAWWYFFERSGNYGPPLALFLYAGWGKTVKDWLMPIRAFTLTVNKIEAIKWVLRWSIAVQLITHGLYGVVEAKPLLIGHFAAVGLPGSWMDPETFLMTVGWIEIGMGALILLKPVRAAVALIIVWEVFVGLLYPISGLPVTEHPQAYLIFRTLERFGDYAGPFGLLLLMIYGPKWKEAKGKAADRPAAPGLPAPAAAASD